MVQDAPVVEAPSGLTLTEMALSAERAFLHACCDLIPEQKDADPDWVRAAAWAYHFWDDNQKADDAVPFARLAAEMFGKVAPAGATIGALPAQAQVAFEAACRHLFGLITCDKDDLKNLPEREASWLAWAEARLAKLEAAK